MKLLGQSVLLALVLCCAVPHSAIAQIDTATVIGTIADPQGAVLPGVTVTAKNLDTGFIRTGVSDAEGRFRIAAIPPGPYELTAELQGFAAGVRRGVTLTVGSQAVINFAMQLASVTEAVTVTAETPVVQTTTAAVEQTMTRDQIDLLPLIGRSYESLIRLAPGAAPNNSSYSFVGSRGRSNAWSIDGVDNSEDISGYSRQTPSLDAIKEVQIVTTGFRAEYGTASGGVVNVVTRSGTNDLHGSGFFLFRNQDLMARSPYADRSLPTDPFRRIHYGATAGGPIKRDKLLYFLTYERQDRDANSASTRTLPTANAAFVPSTRQFLQSNGIDPALFGAGGRVRQVRPEFVDTHGLTARIDNQLNQNSFLTFRYSFDWDKEPSGRSGTLYDFNGATSFFRTNYATVSHKWIVGPNKLHEAFLQIGQSFGDWKVSYPKLVNITVSGAFSLGGASNFPQGRTDYIYQVIDNFTWTLTGTRTGEHAVKLGGNIKIFKSDSFFDSNFRGTYTFPNLQAFIDGRPSRFTQNRGDSRLARPNQIYAAYLQDDWRVNNSLTMNLGIRYDFEGAKTEALRDVSGAPGPGISGDKNNVSPRFGFSWAPGGTTKQAIYGGTGLYYDQVILNIIGNARFTPPKVIGIQIDNPSWPDPTAGGSLSIPPPSLSIIDPHLVTPHSWTSQVGYRRELAKDLGLDVSFIYNRGEDQVGIINTNAGIPGTASLTGTGAVRPDPTATNKSFYTNFGIIRYKGLLTQLTKRFSHNLQAGVNYTLSKTEDNAFNFVSAMQVPEKPDLNYGPGDSDRRHRLEGHFEYHLPLDFQLGAIVEYRSEGPMNIAAGGRDLNGDGITGDWVNASICRNLNCSGFNYSRNGVFELSTDEANRLRALFGLAPIEKFENNPKYFNIDVTLQKAFRIRDRSIRATVEAFNPFNTPQRILSEADGAFNILSSLFGQYTQVSQPRAIQFTLQFDF